MAEVRDYHLSKEIDRYYIMALVRSINNDTELGAQVRKYVNKVTTEKDETKVIE